MRDENKQKIHDKYKENDVSHPRDYDKLNFKKSKHSLKEYNTHSEWNILSGNYN